jgi:hypothetical protein
VLGVATRREGFIGIAETLARLDLSGATIVEHPVTLEARLFGRSKLRLARSAAGHLGLLSELAWGRMRRGRRAGRRAALTSGATSLDRVVH